MTLSLFRGSSHEIELIRPLTGFGDHSVVLASVPHAKGSNTAHFQLLALAFAGTLMIQVLSPLDLIRFRSLPLLSEEPGNSINLISIECSRVAPSL